MVAPPMVIGVGVGRGRGALSSGTAMYSTRWRQFSSNDFSASPRRTPGSATSKVALRRPRNPPKLGSRVTWNPRLHRAFSAFSASCACTTTIKQVSVTRLEGFASLILAAPFRFRGGLFPEVRPRELSHFDHRRMSRVPGQSKIQLSFHDIVL